MNLNCGSRIIYSINMWIQGKEHGKGYWLFSTDLLKDYSYYWWIKVNTSEYFNEKWKMEKLALYT